MDDYKKDHKHLLANKYCIEVLKTCSRLSIFIKSIKKCLVDYKVDLQSLKPKMYLVK